MDETTVSLRFPLRACWMKRGQQKRVPAFTSPDRRLHLIGALNFRTQEVCTQAVERKNSQTFIEFLEYLLVEKYPHQKIILVLDNASYHRSQASLAALSLFEPRIQVFWLPKYCPNLNQIERFWRHLKDLVCANRLDIALESIIRRVEQIMRYQNSENHPLKLSFLDNFV
ncbi:MAG: IS630 family transposase [Anaerolineales bacterium]